MPKITTSAFTQTILHIITTFIDTDSTTPKTIATGGANDSRVIHITISSDDGAANIAYFSLENGEHSSDT